MDGESNDRRKHNRVYVGLLVRVRYTNVDEFIEYYATNIGPGGIFLQSRKLYSKGTLLKFEIQLKDGQTVLQGRGVVVWKREPSMPGQKPLVPGMGVKFLQLDESSKKIVQRIVRIKNAESGVKAERDKAEKGKAKKAAKPVDKPAGAPSVEVDFSDFDMSMEAPPSGYEPNVTVEGLPTEMREPAPSQAARAAAVLELEQMSHGARPWEPPAPGSGLPGVDIEVEGDPEPSPVDIELEVETEPLPVDIEVEVEPDLPAASIEVDTDLGAEADGLDLGVDSSGIGSSRSSSSSLAQGGASSIVIGIDLGTTNSCASVVMNGKPQIIPSRLGYRTIPSIVAYDETGRLLVGQAAKNQMEINPTNTVYGSKRLIGRPFSSPTVRQMRDRFHYQIIEGPNHEAAVRISGRTFSLQQVAAFILSEIRDIARELLNAEVNRAVITVPAYYNENQRQAVREAGMLAGFHVERILNEPTSAALAFGYNRGLEQRVLVYDLGGGTFDASLLELTENVYEVIATGGDTFLGGLDFDNQLCDLLLYEFIREVGGLPKLDRSAMQRLRDAAESAKCALSEKEETIARLPFFTTVRNMPKDLEVRVSRAQLEELVRPLVDRTIAVTLEVLRRASLNPDQVDSVLLVGGQSRMPLIWSRIQETFGRPPSKGVNPDEAVAVGAALLADSMNRIDSVVLIDVLPMSIGLGLPGGRFLPVLPSGTALPTTKIYTISTFQDLQTSMELLLFQGESDRVIDNEYLSTLMITGLPPLPKGEVRIELNFALDQECLLKVTARDQAHSRPLDAKMLATDDVDSIRAKLRVPESEQPADQINASLAPSLSRPY